MNDTTMLRGATAIEEGTRYTRRPGLTARLSNESYRARVIEAGQMYDAAASGNLFAQAALQEAMTRDDFPKLFGDYLGYTLAAQYQDAPSVWQQFAARQVVPDFKAMKTLDVTGGRGTLPEVPEYAPYPEWKLAESDYSLTVAKRGAAMSWSWEASVDDNLGVFDRVPANFAVAAKRTEDSVATSVLIDSDGSGPASWLGTPGTAALSASALETALEAITSATDDDGAPIVVDTPILLVPQGLALTAQNIVNTVLVDDPTTGRRITGNGLSATPRVVVNPWLTVLNSDAKASTTWFLLPAPSSPHPAIRVGFLRGYETPDIRVRNDQGSRPGGGSIAPEEGDFDHDAIQYRVRHVVGAATMYDDAVYVSTGS